MNNSLLYSNLELSQQAFEWDPSTVTAGSHKKVKWVCKLFHKWDATVASRALGNKSGCPFCTNRRVLVGFNDLTTTHSEIAKQAFGWDPRTLTFGSNKKVKWKCELEHIWEVVVAKRTNRGDGCPFCSGHRVFTGFNDLATTYPAIARQAFEWDPTTLLAGSNKKRKWKCELEHIWEASVNSRASNAKKGCPYCAGKRVLVGFNDLAITPPEIAEQAFEWDPKTLTFGSNKKRKWKCKLDHTWEAIIKSRTSIGTGCPSCAWYGYSIDKEGYFYLISHKSWGMFKIGITNFPKQRLDVHTAQGWEVVDVLGPMDPILTRNWEKIILKMIKEKGLKLNSNNIGGKFDGYTEAWISSFLLVQSLEQLMDMAEKHKKTKDIHE